jgi:hypothetical protein
MSPIEPDGVVAPRIPIDLASILHLNRYIAGDWLCVHHGAMCNKFIYAPCRAKSGWFTEGSSRHARLAREADAYIIYVFGRNASQLLLRQRRRAGTCVQMRTDSCHLSHTRWHCYKKTAERNHNLRFSLVALLQNMNFFTHLSVKGVWFEAKAECVCVNIAMNHVISIFIQVHCEKSESSWSCKNYQETLIFELTWNV